MDFRILGPVGVLSEGEPIKLGGPRQQALLAYLLLHAEEVTPSERLVCELWHEPPGGGVAALQTHISRLRHALGGRIDTSGIGYRLRLEPEELDLARFRSLLADAAGAGEPGERARLLRSAEGLWHGPPLDGLDAPFVAGEVRALDELRLAAVEARVDAELESGCGGALVPELSALVAHHPLRERLRAQLILALYRDGRQVEALEAYQDTRRMLDEELGLEPSPALRDLERAILLHDGSLMATPTSAETAVPAEAVRRRRMLIAAVVLAAAGVGTAVVAADLNRRTTPAVAPASRPRRSRPTAPTPVPVEVTTSPSTSTASAPTMRRTPPRHHTPVHAPATRARRVAAPPAVATTTAVTVTTPAAAKHVRTHVAPKARVPVPTTTPGRSPTKTAPPSKVISDTFDGAFIDGTIWYQIHFGDGWTLSQHDGRLEYSFPPGTTPGPPYGVYGGHVGTQCKFPGDFDARVDYELVAWPVANNTAVTLWAFLAPNNEGLQVWRQSSAQWGEQYGSYMGGDSSGAVSLDDRTGTLRLVRRKGVVTGYFLHNSKWMALTSGFSTSYATIAVGASSLGTNSTFGGEQVTVEFDNFHVSGTSPACPVGASP